MIYFIFSTVVVPRYRKLANMAKNMCLVVCIPPKVRIHSNVLCCYVKRKTEKYAKGKITFVLGRNNVKRKWRSYNNTYLLFRNKVGPLLGKLALLSIIAGKNSIVISALK